MIAAVTGISSTPSFSLASSAPAFLERDAAVSAPSFVEEHTRRKSLYPSLSLPLSIFRTIPSSFLEPLLPATTSSLPPPTSDENCITVVGDFIVVSLGVPLLEEGPGVVAVVVIVVDTFSPSSKEGTAGGSFVPFPSLFAVSSPLPSNRSSTNFSTLFNSALLLLRRRLLSLSWSCFFFSKMLLLLMLVPLPPSPILVRWLLICDAIILILAIPLDIPLENGENLGLVLLLPLSLLLAGSDWLLGDVGLLELLLCFPSSKSSTMRSTLERRGFLDLLPPTLLDLLPSPNFSTLSERPMVVAGFEVGEEPSTMVVGRVDDGCLLVSKIFCKFARDPLLSSTLGESAAASNAFSSVCSLSPFLVESLLLPSLDKRAMDGVVRGDETVDARSNCCNAMIRSAWLDGGFSNDDDDCLFDRVMLRAFCFSFICSICFSFISFMCPMLARRAVTPHPPPLPPPTPPVPGLLLLPMPPPVPTTMPPVALLASNLSIFS
mmetsp:Transcript_5891/g.12911  ORF Transcript_5891/g.12911 Transcript_5891/m.12911 type:complete len:491 (-) Transcript_5891:940-2412(-)